MKWVYTTLTLILILLLGEISSDNKIIVSRDDNYTTWKISHLFNLYHTTFITPTSDTIQCKIVSFVKNAVSLSDSRYMTTYQTILSDGKNRYDVKTKQAYEVANSLKSDSDDVTLIMTYIPSSYNKNNWYVKYDVIYDK